MIKNQEGETNEFQPAKNSIHLLELLSRNGDKQKHSPCEFCCHRGMETCPHGTVKKLGPCADYDARHHSPEVFGKRILDYVLTPRPELGIAA
jgi:hypothetical protein